MHALAAEVPSQASLAGHLWVSAAHQAMVQPLLPSLVIPSQTLVAPPSAKEEEEEEAFLAAEPFRAEELS